MAGVLDEPHLDIVPRSDAESSRIAKATAMPTDFSKPQAFEQLSAGAATVRATADSNAFSLPSKNLSFEDQLNFRVGNGFFRKLWVSAPSSTLASDGLGPLFNARSCQRCHIKDGRGHPPENADDNNVSFFLRVSIPGDDTDLVAEIEDYIATRPDPIYGGQLQDTSLPGLAPEYRLVIDYEEVPVALSDGEMASLRKPTYQVTEPGYGPLHPEAMFSPRVAPQMIGLGLIEAIPATDILALADPDDSNNDGISGRPNIVWSDEFDQSLLGRFGLKAGTATLQEQSAKAFSGDIGISSPMFPAPWGDCTAAEAACREQPHGDQDERGVEIDQQSLDLVSFYSRNLAVPERRDVADATVLRGKELFHESGCAACHQPAFVTHRLANESAQSFQLIWPYTDLLLHDMGEGLADNRPESRATGREWRTPPLWGIGLTQQVSGHSNFLHDGRARSLLEAILWHGGEAEQARNKVIAMPADQRRALLRFLESL